MYFQGCFLIPAGNPVWLATVQVKVLPVSDKYLQYAEQIVSRLKEADIRVEPDGRGEKLGYKIRQRMNKI